MKSIELDRSGPDTDGVAAAIVAELLAGDAEPDVVLRIGGARAVWTMCPAPDIEASGDVLGPESVVVITGGARGVTAACARALARAFRPRIALIGRTPLVDDPPELREAATETDIRSALVTQAVRAGDRPRPAAIETELRRVLAVREIRATLADIEAAGSSVRYLRADVGDIESLRGALEEVRAEWGPITGIVHGAGVLADRLVVDKTDEQFDRVLRAKAQGLENLLELVDGADKPALVCVFSSVAVSAGNSGQCDYAAANEIAERLAEQWRLRHPACLVKAIAWGPWSGGMVSQELAEVFAERNVPLIPLAAGAEAFVAELGDAREVRCLITAGDGFGAPPSRGGEVAVSEVAQVWLADHRIGDRAVVPLAVVCDWMLRLVDEPGPGTLRDVDVRRGITAPAVVTIRREGTEFTVDTADRPACYRGRFGGADENPFGDWSEAQLALPALEDGAIEDIYDGETLFQGTSLRTLAEVHGLGPAGAAGSVVGATDMGWPEEPWRMDPAALDGAIQLAVLWAKSQIGAATLPMSLRAGRFHASGPLSGPLRCLVRAVRVGAQNAVCDVRLARPAGGPSVAELCGLELVARPRPA
ncbi:SDR family NAD(P)-dependent oxidoreductase [Actinospica robiniae]|uniref:SDR family NAD(P)-dependent oxidoreductase n=1 Tax=Actinospica robiniae TaxID=304901 RepID=UPI0012FA6811|nr:SDR family NAD(P)-dependent oxidoreductase [Actinospica robiniae]